MSRHIKQFLVSASAILMIAGVGASANNIHVHAYSNARTGFDDTVSPNPVLRTKWDGIPGVDEDQYESHFNRKVGTVSVNKHPVTVRRHGHTMTVVPRFDVPGKIIKVDGHRVTSKKQILRILRHHHRARRYRVKRHHSRKYRRRASKRHGRRRVRRHSRRYRR